jgi:hypothetical protein
MYTRRSIMFERLTCTSSSTARSLNIQYNAASDPERISLRRNQISNEGIVPDPTQEELNYEDKRYRKFNKSAMGNGFSRIH